MGERRGRDSATRPMIAANDMWCAAGDVEDISMTVSPQSQFAPLADCLCKSSFPELTFPGREAVSRALVRLTRDRTLRAASTRSARREYFLEPRGSTPRDRPLLLSNDEALARLHGAPSPDCLRRSHSLRLLRSRLSPDSPPSDTEEPYKKEKSPSVFSRWFGRRSKHGGQEKMVKTNSATLSPADWSDAASEVRSCATQTRDSEPDLRYKIPNNDSRRKPRSAAPVPRQMKNEQLTRRTNKTTAWWIIISQTGWYGPATLFLYVPSCRSVPRPCTFIPALLYVCTAAVSVPRPCTFIPALLYVCTAAVYVYSCTAVCTAAVYVPSCTTVGLYRGLLRPLLHYYRSVPRPCTSPPVCTAAVYVPSCTTVGLYRGRVRPLLHYCRSVCTAAVYVPSCTTVGLYRGLLRPLLHYCRSVPRAVYVPSCTTVGLYRGRVCTAAFYVPSCTTVGLYRGRVRPLLHYCRSVPRPCTFIPSLLYVCTAAVYVPSCTTVGLYRGRVCTAAVYVYSCTTVGLYRGRVCTADVYVYSCTTVGLYRGRVCTAAVYVYSCTTVGLYRGRVCTAAVYVYSCTTVGLYRGRVCTAAVYVYSCTTVGLYRGCVRLFLHYCRSYRGRVRNQCCVERRQLTRRPLSPHFYLGWDCQLYCQHSAVHRGTALLPAHCCPPRHNLTAVHRGTTSLLSTAAQPHCCPPRHNLTAVHRGTALLPAHCCPPRHNLTAVHRGTKTLLSTAAQPHCCPPRHNLIAVHRGTTSLLSTAAQPHCCPPRHKDTAVHRGTTLLK
ncbi:STOX1, partial [Cordylochernes scorpioides]